jgi:hypothetical protein
LRQPKRPLSGLLRCGSCGGGMTSIGVTKETHRLQCSTWKESGACANGRKVSRDAIEQTVFAGLAEELAQPAVIARRHDGVGRAGRNPAAPGRRGDRARQTERPRLYARGERQAVRTGRKRRVPRPF